MWLGCVVRVSGQGVFDGCVTGVCGTGACGKYVWWVFEKGEWCVWEGYVMSLICVWMCKHV